jgi:hypothetical protein
MLNNRLPTKHGRKTDALRLKTGILQLLRQIKKELRFIGEMKPIFAITVNKEKAM